MLQQADCLLEAQQTMSLAFKKSKKGLYQKIAFSVNYKDRVLKYLNKRR